MFTPDDRERLRDTLVAAARADERVTGAALTGSESVGRADRWSDIDLALCVAGDPRPVLADWSDRMYAEHGAVHHVDVVSGATVYRVFLLADTLQVDIAFCPAAEFGAKAPTFRLLFGTPRDVPPTPRPVAEHLVGMAWLYGLHARSSILRRRVWQAEYMVSGMRDHVLELVCLRHGVPAAQGRGLDQLPAEVTGPYTAALVGTLDVAGLWRAFGVVGKLLLAEAALVDAALADRLTGPVTTLTSRSAEASSTDV
ncbi:MAG TPA: nucleotidyltransferase domain-containing protein [Pseudonocardiaceae bacterium]|nr:nucleotidyltransferase domain-containing protein [Pseudonocardiaceae bacterium]